MPEFPASFVFALGQALLHFLWQGALIGLVAAPTLHALRDARPQARYAVACVALLACVLAPLATLIAPLAATTWVSVFDATSSTLAQAETDSPLTGALIALTAPAARSEAFLPWIVALWAVGTCVMSLRMALGLAWIRRLRRTPLRAAHAAWQARFDALAMHFGLRRAVALRVVDGLDSPVSAGWWRPVVLLPAAMLTRMPVHLIEALLAHELAHIRRHDYLVNLLQNAVEAVLFYHPVTWWLSRRIRIERELIADQLATEVVCAPRSLALALSELSEFQRTGPALHLAQAAGGGQLLSRIERLLRPARRTHAGARIVVPLLGLFAAGIASFAYAHIVQPEPVIEGEQGGRAPVAATRDTYALVLNGGRDIWIWGPDDDMTEIEAAQRGAQGDLLWVRRNRQDYVVTDPALIARAEIAWRKSDGLGRRIEVLNAQLEQDQQETDALARRLETMPAEGGRAQRQAMDALARDAALSNSAMARRNREWNALSRQHDQAAEQAAREMRAVTDEAMARNLAMAAPTRSDGS